MSKSILALIVLLASSRFVCADEPVTLRVVAWNMEGNGRADAGKLRDQLSAKDGVDLWGLSEVRSNRFDTFLEGAEGTEGTDFEIIKGSTGGSKLRLAIIYDTSVLEQVGANCRIRMTSDQSRSRA